MFPAIMMLESKVDLHEWTPFRTLRLANQVQTGLSRCAVGFECVARHARADNILPSCWPAPIPGDHVIQVQILAVKLTATILTCVSVALENIMAGELDFFFRQTIEKDQKNDPRHPNLK